MNAWSQVVIVLASVAGGQMGASFIGWLRNRKGEKAKAAREQKAYEDAVEKTKQDRKTLLADAQAIAQETALTSAHGALKQVEERCNQCVDELRGLRDVTGSLIDALEALMDEDTPAVRADARATIRLARRAM